MKSTRTYTKRRKLEKGNEAETVAANLVTLEKESQSQETIPKDSESELTEGFYKVEKILDKKCRGKMIYYNVKWENYPESENSWEPISNLRSVRDQIDEYEEGKGGKKRKYNKQKYSLETPEVINTNTTR